LKYLCKYIDSFILSHQNASAIALKGKVISKEQTNSYVAGPHIDETVFRRQIFLTAEIFSPKN
jgi:hypothetical protein